MCIRDRLFAAVPARPPLRYSIPVSTVALVPALFLASSMSVPALSSSADVYKRQALEFAQLKVRTCRNARSLSFQQRRPGILSLSLIHI